MFGKREDQAVQRHDFGELAGAVGKSRPRQNLVQPQLPPHLVADMNRARLPGLFHRDSVGIDRQARVDLRRGLRRQGADAACPADLLSKSLDRRIRSYKRGLALQAGFEAVGQIQPLLRGCGGEAAERADDAQATFSETYTGNWVRRPLRSVTLQLTCAPRKYQRSRQCGGLGYFSISHPTGRSASGHQTLCR